MNIKYERIVLHVVSMPFAEFPINGENTTDEQHDGSIGWCKEALLAYRFVVAMTNAGFTVKAYMGREVSVYAPVVNPSVPPIIPGDGFWDVQSDMWTSHKTSTETAIQEAVRLQGERDKQAEVTSVHVMVAFCPIHAAWAWEWKMPCIEFATHGMVSRVQYNIENTDKQICLPASHLVFLATGHRAVIESQVFGVQGFALSSCRAATLPPLIYENEVTQLDTGDRPYAIFVGKKDSLRGLDIAIAAVLAARKKGVCIELVVIGMGSDESKSIITKIAGDANQWVHNLGIVPMSSKASYIAKATVFLSFKMFANSHPGVAYEAFMCGVPIVCTRHGCIAEWCLRHPSAHQVCDDDLEDLSQAIVNVATGKQSNGNDWDWRNSSRAIVSLQENGAERVEAYRTFIAKVVTRNMSNQCLPKQMGALLTSE
jgi:glycosyltransferase involved in cell wall biosynthesis